MLKHNDICERIPHSGNMCLLDTVKYWDENKIICITHSHTDTDNPLRNVNGLSMLALLEYAAQAMAVHGCLVSNQGATKMQEGYLAALRNIELAEGYLSDVKAILEIHVERIYKDAGNMIYTMRVLAGDKVLASGRATVIATFSG